MSLFNRISVYSIVKKHLNTFYDESYRVNGKDKIPFADKIVFIGIPLLISLIFVLLGLYMDATYLSIILTCLSIFVGLLFGLLPLMFQLTTTIKAKYLDLKKANNSTSIPSKEYKFQEIKFRISKELFSNIGFSIILAIVSILSSLLTRLKPQAIIKVLEGKYFNTIKSTYLFVSNFIAYFLLTLFVLMLFMVLKRFYLLFESEVREE